MKNKKTISLPGSVVLSALVVTILGLTLWMIYGQLLVPRLQQSDTGQAYATQGGTLTLPILDQKKPEKTEMALFALG
ncbi:MAG: hypothetical protein OQK97_04215 [Deltaproteobacteria bacterium]|jgi:uncharacterized protein with PQ loop repeat|nr:hypothetical protein [Deltaproteobacteria bacterium]